VNWDKQGIVWFFRGARDFSHLQIVQQHTEVAQLVKAPRFLMGSLEFFIDLILLGTYWH